MSTCMSIKQFCILYTSCILIDVASTQTQVCTLGHGNYNSNFRELHFYINLFDTPSSVVNSGKASDSRRCRVNPSPHPSPFGLRQRPRWM